MLRDLRAVVLFICCSTFGCSSNPEEGTLVKPGPGVEGIPGGPMGVQATKAVPISGGTLTIANGSTAIASDPDRDRIFVVDLQTESVSEIALQDGDEPGRSVVDNRGRAYVSLRRGGAIAVVDLASRSLLQRRAVCPAPRGIAYDATQDMLHVACDTGELVSLPASGGAPVRVVNLGRDLRDVIVRGDSLVVSRFRSAEIMTVDATGQVVHTQKPSPSTPTFTAPNGFEPMVAWRTVALSDGRVAVIHERANPGEIAIGAAGYYESSDVCAGGIVHGTVSIVDPVTDTPQTGTLALPLIVGASDVAVSPDGAQVAVVSSGNSWPVAGQRLPNVMIMSLAGLGATDPCAMNGETTSGEATSVAFDGQGRVVVQSREPAQLEVIGGSTIRLSDDSRADTGVALFDMNSGFGVACASCHPEGRDDGRVWQFSGVGPRRTQTFSRGVLQTAPFHWSGDVADMPSLVHEVFVSRMGGPQPNRFQVEYFADFLDRIEPPVPQAIDGTAVARGEALFNDPSVGCSGCHKGAHFTNNESHDVGTGASFQVPSLIGVGARAPYMHNGCAATLRDRFGPCGGTAHGFTENLSDAQIDDLVAYLSSL